MCDCVAKSIYEGADANEFQRGLEDVADAPLRELYRCAECGTLWEKTYPYPWLHGEGPSVLTRVSWEYVRQEWRIALYDSPDLVRATLDAVAQTLSGPQHAGEGADAFLKNQLYARVMPWSFARYHADADFRLAPGEEAFITATDDIKDLLCACEVAKRLCMHDAAGELNTRADGLVVMTFPDATRPTISDDHECRVRPSDSGIPRSWAIATDTPIEVALAIRLQPSVEGDASACFCGCGTQSKYEGTQAVGFVRGLHEVWDDVAKWRVLYRCERCESLWEETFPHGEQHGGGLPLLKRVSKEYVLREWKMKFA